MNTQSSNISYLELRSPMENEKENMIIQGIVNSPG